MSGAILFSPAHPQPFTLEQAVQLDINILVAEISRLRNSITHLQKTQTELRSFLADEPGDPDITQAIQENDDTIASQTERIALIKVALMNKVGKDALKHYDLGPEERGSSDVGGDGASGTAERSSNDDRPQTDAVGEEGLHL